MELIEQIFTRLDSIRVSQDYSKDEKKSIFYESKEMLKYEIDLFRSTIEGKLVELINKYLVEKTSRSELMIKNIYK